MKCNKISNWPFSFFFFFFLVFLRLKIGIGNRVLSGGSLAIPSMHGRGLDRNRKRVVSRDKADDPSPDGWGIYTRRRVAARSATSRTSSY